MRTRDLSVKSAGVGALIPNTVTGSTPRYLLGDALGSVRGSSDGDGALIGSPDYEVFGGVRGTSTTGSIFGFTGEQMDAETGFVYLRARYFDPRTGRFVSRDTVQPNAPGTQGYHVYAYAANNPTTWTDPSGHISGMALGAVTVSLILAAYYAVYAQQTWTAIGGFNESGLTLSCAEDTDCGAALEWATTTLENAFNHPDASIRRLLDSIYQVFPGARFVVYLSVGLAVIEAFRECVVNGRCLPKKEDPCERAGSYVPVRNPAGTSAVSMAYEVQVTGKAPYTEFVVRTNPSRPFDGCVNGTLIEAKCRPGQWDDKTKNEWKMQLDAQQRIANRNLLKLDWVTAASDVPQDLKTWFAGKVVPLRYQPAPPPCGN
jgi:RHS repeat-associated protein